MAGSLVHAKNATLVCGFDRLGLNKKTEMNIKSIAPCGINCELCLGFQRSKNKCVGCIKSGNKPGYCIRCSIKQCSEKKGKENLLCSKCAKFPCQRIKNLNKRYTTKYGESNIDNLTRIKKIGIRLFVEQEKLKWKCKKCGNYICVHRDICLSCGAKNPFFPS